MPTRRHEQEEHVELQDMFMTFALKDRERARKVVHGMFHFFEITVYSYCMRVWKQFNEYKIHFEQQMYKAMTVEKARRILQGTTSMPQRKSLKYGERSQALPRSCKRAAANTA